MEKENLFTAAIIILALSAIITTFSLAIIDNNIQQFQEHHSSVQSSVFGSDEEGRRVLSVYHINECFRAEGISMQPTIFQGNIVCFSPINPDKLMLGNIISYNNINNITAIHRITGINQAKQEITLRGDNTQESEHIKFNQVRGILVANLYY